ncbi:MAG: sulfur reduction protein DsrE [Rhodanobacteraceae bacterium]|nr:MAG: sulfur reduction protein DsrE [Rhodanobacteraceae bacterium]
MRKIRLLLLPALLFGVVIAAAAKPPVLWTPPPGFWSTPTVPGYGRIHYMPKDAYQPDPSQTYKIVFALTKAGAKPDDVSPSLDHIARTVNLYVAAGVPLSHLKFVGIAYGAATPLALDNAHYRAEFGVDNPNLKLVQLLRKDGVDIAVCAQAVAEHDFKYAWVSPHVTLALSGLTTVTVLEHQGYALMPL